MFLAGAMRKSKSKHDDATSRFVALAGAELAEKRHIIFRSFALPRTKLHQKTLTHDDQPTYMISFVLFQWRKITTHALLPLSARGLMKTRRMILMELLYPAEARLESASNGRPKQGDKS